MRQDFIDGDNCHIDGCINECVAKKVDHIFCQQGVYCEIGGEYVDDANDQYGRPDHQRRHINNSDHCAGNNGRWRRLIAAASEQLWPTQSPSQTAIAGNDGAPTI